jgi:hypothetical protein
MEDEKVDRAIWEAIKSSKIIDDDFCFFAATAYGFWMNIENNVAIVWFRVDLLANVDKVESGGDVWVDTA